LTEDLAEGRSAWVMGRSRSNSFDGASGCAVPVRAGGGGFAGTCGFDTLGRRTTAGRADSSEGIAGRSMMASNSSVAGADSRCAGGDARGGPPIAGLAAGRFAKGSSPMPIEVVFGDGRGGGTRFGRGGPGGGEAGSGAGAPGEGTTKACPHLGHRIFNPAGGTRLSSTWYGALHASHSTFSIARKRLPQAQRTRPSAFRAKA
jgi:hypothetical protein